MHNLAALRTEVEELTIGVPPEMRFRQPDGNWPTVEWAIQAIYVLAGELETAGTGLASAEAAAQANAAALAAAEAAHATSHTTTAAALAALEARVDELESEFDSHKANLIIHLIDPLL